jgi:hypothetical protein
MAELQITKVEKEKHGKAAVDGARACLSLTRQW